MNIRSNSLTSNMLGSLYQNQMSLNSKKLNRTQFPLPINNAKRFGALGTATAQYVTNIREAASSVKQALRELGTPEKSDEPENGSREPDTSSNDVGRRTSSKVRINDAMTATLNTVSHDKIKISGVRDYNHAVDSVQRLVMSFNSLRSEAANRTGASAQVIETRLLNISHTFAKALSNIGIGPDSNGWLGIQPERLEQAAQDGSLEQFFEMGKGTNLSFSNRLSRLADDVLRNPSNFIEDVESGSNSRNFQYSNAGSMIQANFMTPGALLDFLL